MAFYNGHISKIPIFSCSGTVLFVSGKSVSLSKRKLQISTFGILTSGNLTGKCKSKILRLRSRCALAAFSTYCDLVGIFNYCVRCAERIGNDVEQHRCRKSGKRGNTRKERRIAGELAHRGLMSASGMRTWCRADYMQWVMQPASKNQFWRAAATCGPKISRESAGNFSRQNTPR